MIIKLQNVIGCVPFSIHKVPPPGWKYLGRMPIGEAYQHKATSLTVISSIDTIEKRKWHLEGLARLRFKKITPSLLG